MLHIDAIRSQYPALDRLVDGHQAVFFDGPAGSQVPAVVADAVRDYLLHQNANTHGAFVSSEESDAMLVEAARACADLLGVDNPSEIAFGANMTSLTFGLSRALSKEWTSKDEIILSRSEHDANVSPWLLAAEDCGATVHFVPMRDDTTLDLKVMEGQLNERTRLVAVGAASNATGTAHPIRTISDLAHTHGAEVFVDAVHYAPHAAIDVPAWGCDYLACSAYKFFGPHVGILWGHHDRMASLPAYKVRPASNAMPDRWMTGTQNHEGIAGTLAAINYLASLCEPTPETSRRQALLDSFEAIKTYEHELLSQLIDGLGAIDAITVWGLTDEARQGERVPTLSFTHQRHDAATIARRLGNQGIFVWDGNYYALEVTQSLGLEPDGMVRVGILHYNTAGEVDRLLEALRSLD